MPPPPLHPPPPPSTPGHLPFRPRRGDTAGPNLKAPPRREPGAGLTWVTCLPGRPPEGKQAQVCSVYLPGSPKGWTLLTGSSPNLSTALKPRPFWPQLAALHSDPTPPPPQVAPHPHLPASPALWVLFPLPPKPFPASPQDKRLLIAEVILKVIFRLWECFLRFVPFLPPLPFLSVPECSCASFIASGRKYKVTDGSVSPPDPQLHNDSN